MRCTNCTSGASFGLCSADCALAPWNQDRPIPPAGVRMIAYLLRQRRWVGEHVNDYARWITWCDPEHARAWGGPLVLHYAGRLR